MFSIGLAELIVAGWGWSLQVLYLDESTGEYDTGLFRISYDHGVVYLDFFWFQGIRAYIKAKL